MRPGTGSHGRLRSEYRSAPWSEWDAQPLSPKPGTYSATLDCPPVRLLRPLSSKNGLRKPDPLARPPHDEGSSSAATCGMVPSFPAEVKRSSFFHSCATQKSKA